VVSLLDQVVRSAYETAALTRPSVVGLKQRDIVHHIEFVLSRQWGECLSLLRFAPLLPSRADFDAPFVEPVKIIREWDGEKGNDQFGWIARNIGDVDGDGVPDVVTYMLATNSAQVSKSRRHKR
jgi:hypothetical protein